MTLLEAIKNLEQLDDDFTIYASARWSVNSIVTVEYEPEDGSMPNEAKNLGLNYFLEVFIAKEFVEGWLSNIASQPSDEDICKRIIEYAENDA